MRAALQERLAALTRFDIAAAASALGATALSLPELGEARIVSLFAGGRAEPPTRSIFDGLIDARHTVVLPRVEAKELRWYVLSRWSELRPGWRGILEPPAEAACEVFPAQIDLWLVPGLAFDARGGRLGRGGGYFDRTLDRARPTAARFGIGLEIQLVDEVPLGEADVALDGVVTPRQVVRASKSRRVAR